MTNMIADDASTTAGEHDPFSLDVSFDGLMWNVALRGDCERASASDPTMELAVASVLKLISDRRSRDTVRVALCLELTAIRGKDQLSWRADVDVNTHKSVTVSGDSLFKTMCNLGSALDQYYENGDLWLEGEKA